MAGGGDVVGAVGPGGGCQRLNNSMINWGVTGRPTSWAVGRRDTRPSGGSVLEAETERLRRNVEAASRRLQARAAAGRGKGAAATARGVRPAPALRLAGGPA